LINNFRSYPLVLEIRHSSGDDPDILARLAEEGVNFCNIDQRRLGKSMGRTQHVTAAVGYVRLHGRNYKEWFQADNRNDRYNYLYKPMELEGWKERLARLARKTFVVTNNHYKGQAAANALELKSMLSGRKVKGPEPLIQHYREALQEFSDPG
jgi:uncharacterized protein YecE (DUF72 family)